ncbi:protein canopy 4 [Teleopsis dalmanni]|uniref:protein canopy 4 n=1 Tax=Teleopsis dalmanni TaxID=139649 RepID=UPI0018CF3A42|nr:protein canopy 4 [Teleopsis dalmanni]
MFLKQLILIALLIAYASGGAEEKEGVIYANRCEACKVLATELQGRLQETGKSHDVIETGYLLDDVRPKKRTEYRRSELRLLESMENVCERILNYNLHKERKDSTRFAKGMSQTFKALHGLVNKGVQVDLGIPLELWDKPPVEVTQMKIQCDQMLENYEDVISNWYFKLQDDVPLLKHLCEDTVLRQDERKCLTEVLPEINEDDMERLGEEEIEKLKEKQKKREEKIKKTSKNEKVKEEDKPKRVRINTEKKQLKGEKSEL